MREKAPASVTQVVKLPPPVPYSTDNHPCFRNYLGIHGGPKLYPWGTTPGFAETFCKLMGEEPEKSDDDSDTEECHKNWWRCKVCMGFWRQTGKIGWDESKCEQQRNIDLGRLQKTCSECGGILWKATSPDYRDERTPSPTGQQKINRERWIFAGMDAPLWDGGHFRISMIRGEEPTMSSGDEPEPPGYQTPSEDNMDCIGPLTPQYQVYDPASQEAWRAFTQQEASPPDAYWDASPSDEEHVEIDLREREVLYLPAPPRHSTNHLHQGLGNQQSPPWPWYWSPKAPHHRPGMPPGPDRPPQAELGRLPCDQSRPWKNHDRN